MSQERVNLKCSRSKLKRNQMKSRGGRNSALVQMTSLLYSLRDKNKLKNQEKKVLGKSNNLLNLRRNLM